MSAKLISSARRSTLLLMLLLPGRAAAQATNAPAPPNQIVMAQGQVEVRKAGSDQWTPASSRQTLQSGDRVRTRERSRAEIYLGSGQTIQKGELSEIEIPPTANPTFQRGLFKIFNREPARGSKFGLPNTTTAGIRGTDFLVRVGDDGNAEVIVLDGEVVLTNPQGEVTLGRNERGVVELGRPPVKSAVLAAVNELIQWNLYYPAVVNVPEFGLNADERRVLADSVAAYTSGDLVRAADLYPWERANVSAAESLYRAALLLSVGQVEKANALLNDTSSSAARALTRLIEAVKFITTTRPRGNRPPRPSGWPSRITSRHAMN